MHCLVKVHQKIKNQWKKSKVCTLTSSQRFSLILDRHQVSVFKNVGCGVTSALQVNCAVINVKLNYLFLDVKPQTIMKLLHVFRMCTVRLTVTISLACLQVYLEVPKFCPQLTKVWSISKPAFSDCWVCKWLSLQPSWGCELAAIISSQLLLNYSFILAWPTFHFQSRRVTLCDSCLSCSVFNPVAQVHIITRFAVLLFFFKMEY